MYSGFITSKHTSNWLGAHQKFSRMAYRQTVPYIQMHRFPSIDKILHFEGYNGPDGIKVKSTHRHDEPSHYYDPKVGEGSALGHIDNHYTSLVEAIRQDNQTRAAFEAAWLAHALTDGLTPAHHYPYEEERNQLYKSGNSDHSKRRHRLVLQGDTRRKALKSNWTMWGSKGLLSTHIHFEAGVAAAVITSSFRDNINPIKLEQARAMGPLEFFKDEAAAIYNLNLYEQFYRTSWTVGLARVVRHQLAPAIIQAVAIEWVMAAEAAGIGR